MKEYFKSIINGKFFWFFLGSIITISVISCYTFVTSYDKNVNSMAHVMVIYKHETMFTSLSSDARDYIMDGKKELFLGKLPSQDAIEINGPYRATFFVYPSDENSVIVRYEPRKGIKRNYKISGYGNFDKVLNAFYELTDNKIFKATP